LPKKSNLLGYAAAYPAALPSCSVSIILDKICLLPNVVLGKFATNSLYLWPGSHTNFSCGKGNIVTGTSSSHALLHCNFNGELSPLPKCEKGKLSMLLVLYYCSTATISLQTSRSGATGRTGEEQSSLSPLSVRTHHKFRKIQRFFALHQKVCTSASEEPLSLAQKMSALANPSPLSADNLYGRPLTKKSLFFFYKKSGQESFLRNVVFIYISICNPNAYPF